MSDGKTLVIDGTSLYAKCFYATLSSNELQRMTDGHLYAVWKSLFYAIKTEIGIPAKVLFCFDGKPKTNKPRPPKPKGYVEELARFRSEVLPQAFGDGCWALNADYEADDLVATVATALAAQHQRVVVMSGDKDLMQLRSSVVDYYCLNRKRLLTMDEICDKWGINHPNQVSIALALRGDAGDGISGVDRWGDSKIAKFFKTVPKLASLEEIVDLLMRELKPEQQAQFCESLDFTLLHDRVGQYQPVDFKPNPDCLIGEFDIISGMIDPDRGVRAVENWEP
jgi:DNA polymerase I